MSVPTRTAAIAAGLLALTAACSDGASRPGGSKEQEDGWTAVRSTAPVISDTLEAVETLRIGRLEGAPEYMFGSILGLAVDAAGTIYVFDPGQGIRAYDRDGSFSHSVAGLGQGPGEVDYVTAMHTSEAGSLLVFDLGNSRVTRFEGGIPNSLTSVRGLVRPSYQEDAITIHDDGDVWVGFNPLLDSAGLVRFPRPIFGRLTETGSLADTLFAPPRLLEECPTLTEREHRRGFWDDRREPYVPKVKWALGPDGTLVMGCPREYRFEILHPGSCRGRIIGA